jgi:hypothetical protein
MPSEHRGCELSKDGMARSSEQTGERAVFFALRGSDHYSELCGTTTYRVQ